MEHRVLSDEAFVRVNSVSPEKCMTAALTSVCFEHASLKLNELCFKASSTLKRRSSKKAA